LLHAPQLLLSVCVSMHVRPQSVCDPAHTQRPAAQVSPAPQAAPQAPQLVALVCRSTQLGAGALGAQSVCPAAHVGLAGTHAPVRHRSLAAHALPHAPQCIGSAWTSAHVAPQSVCPAPHTMAPVQLDAAQLCPLAHARPQAPQ
jgi:hypothetical protein